jgi:hypothetical protein
VENAWLNKLIINEKVDFGRFFGMVLPGIFVAVQNRGSKSEEGIRIV